MIHKISPEFQVHPHVSLLSMCACALRIFETYSRQFSTFAGNEFNNMQ